MSQHETFDYRVQMDRTNALHTALHTAITHMGQILQPFDQTGRNILQNLENQLNSFVGRDRVLCLEGKGPRASMLRSLKEFFPEKDLEGVIQSQIPKQYEIEYQVWKDWDEYLNLHLLDVKNDLAFGNQRWLVNLDEESLGSAYLGYKDFDRIDPAKMTTGFFSMNTSTVITTGYEWGLCLAMENIVYIARQKNAYFHVYVPIEDAWIKTPGYVFADMEKMKKEFELLLLTSRLDIPKPLSEEQLVQSVLDKVVHHCPVIYNEGQYESFQQPKPQENEYRPWEYDSKISFAHMLSKYDDGSEFRASVKSDNICIEVSSVIFNGGRATSKFRILTPKFAESFDKVPYRVRLFIQKWFEDAMLSTQITHATESSIGVR